MSNISYKHFIYDHELMFYPYAPLGLLHNQGEWPEPKYNLSIIISISIEDYNIIEWIIYHQELGIDHIYLYCTDKDPTDLYRLIIPFTLGEKPFITFHHYRFSKSNSQIYFHFIRNYLHETTWYINLDTTDYLHIHKNQTLSNFLDSFLNISVDGVYFNIVLYQKKEYCKNIQTLFQKAQHIDYPYIHTKLMIRSQSCPYQYLFYNLDKTIDYLHQYINIDKLIKHPLNVLKQNMDTYYNNFPYSALAYMSFNTQKQIIETAYIAHLCDENSKQKYTKNLPKSFTNDDIDSKSSKNDTPFYLQFNSPDQLWQKILKNIWKHSFFPEISSLLSILSQEKPCQQSSTLEKNNNKNMANNLIKGQLRGTTQTITKKENNPWWEIDLQEIFIIKNIRLFNGIDLNIKNMTSFIIESSEDYSSWIKRHQKISLNLFGGADGSYYNWTHPLGIKARWIRISVPGENKVFSLDQIQIFGVEYKNFYIP